MESINGEWDVIQLLEEELNRRKGVEELKHQLNRLKNLADAIQGMINTRECDYGYVHKATNILCKYLGILWRNVFNIKD